jgi:uncharacterized phage protein gp47/JayE
MPHPVPSTQELVDRNIASLESALNQHTPAAEKAFTRTIGTVQAMAEKAEYALIDDRIKAVLAITAHEKDLETLGDEYGIYRSAARPWTGEAHFDLPDGQTLNLNTLFVGINGLKYQTTKSVTAPSGAAGSGVTATLACVEAGASGNLQVGDTLALQTPIAGAGREAIVIDTIAIGTEVEDIEEYRQKVLDAERGEGGGANPSDYRSWAQEIEGVKRAYPFTGAPVGTDSLPGERTVYIEATTDLDPDGVPPQALLDTVRAALIYAPTTGEARQVLGMTQDTLYVEPIVRTGIYITIIGLVITTGNIGDAQAKIEAAMSTYLRTFSPFVQGLDAEFERRDMLTASLVGRDTQNILDSYGGTAENILFGDEEGTYLGKYQLKQNELLKLAGITFRTTDG